MVVYGRIEWDDENLEHATRHGFSDADTEQVIRNTKRPERHPRVAGRWVFKDRTDGGRRATVYADEIEDGMRPVTTLKGWR